MGGLDLGGTLDAAFEQLRGRPDRQERLARDVQDLRAEYPGYEFTVIPGSGKTGIEAVRCQSGIDPYAVIRDDADGIREALRGHTGCGVDHAALSP